MQRILEWQIATITAIRQETARVKTFTLALPDKPPHRAGQHYDIRLTAPDGYQAQRSYSIASEPERAGEIDLTIERIEDGEVSTYLHDVLVPGDQVELRGPVGGYFVWDASQQDPLLLVAGGSGIVPLMAMIRHRCAAGSMVLTRLIYSSRTAADIIYAQELDQLQQSQPNLRVFHTLTRTQPPGWKGYSRRIDAAMLHEVVTSGIREVATSDIPEVATSDDIAAPLGRELLSYVCGPTLLVETVANALVSLGIPAERIRTERFGPTGGPA